MTPDGRRPFLEIMGNPLMEILFQKIERKENVTADDFRRSAKVLADYMRDFPREWVVDYNCNTDAESDGRCLDIMLDQELREERFSFENDSYVHRTPATDEILSLDADGKVQVDYKESTWNFLAGDLKGHCFHKLTKLGVEFVDTIESNPTAAIEILACEIGIYCVRILLNKKKLWCPNLPSSTLPERMELLVNRINHILEGRKAASEALTETEAAEPATPKPSGATLEEKAKSKIEDASGDSTTDQYQIRDDDESAKIPEYARTMIELQEEIRDSLTERVESGLVVEEDDDKELEKEGLDLTKSQRNAFADFTNASTNLIDQTDRSVYDWIRENDNFIGRTEPPTFETWVRHLTAARKKTDSQKNTPRAGREHGKSVIRQSEKEGNGRN
jgi:hypothetical protein